MARYQFLSWLTRLPIGCVSLSLPLTLCVCVCAACAYLCASLLAARWTTLCAREAKIHGRRQHKMMRWVHIVAISQKCQLAADVDYVWAASSPFSSSTAYATLFPTLLHCARHKPLAAFWRRFGWQPAKELRRMVTLHSGSGEMGDRKSERIGDERKSEINEEVEEGCGIWTTPFFWAILEFQNDW